MTDDDDLDAFFEEVQEAEKEATKEDVKEEQEQPPKKKRKPDIPKGVVVAAASADAHNVPKMPEVKVVEEPKAVDSLPHKTSASSSATTPIPKAAPSNKKKQEKPPPEFRIFVGNLDPSVTDIQLYQHFQEYPSLLRANIVRDARKNNVSKGFGFVVFGDALQMAKALRSKDQTWLQSRPIRIKRSKT